MYDYFHKTDLDSHFYDCFLRDRLPGTIMDAHTHFNLPEHVSAITPETIAGDWALECGMIMTCEDAAHYTAVMFPDKNWHFVALPWPLRDADTVANNAYIATIAQKESLRGLYTLRPEYSVDQIEKDYIQGKFCGFKPYPYMASTVKGAEVSIFDFMPHSQFALANRLHATVLMHLPRAGRLPDSDNIAEIRTILNQYPNVKLVLAHFGRCFHHDYFQKSLDILGEDVHRLWFDCAAVLNPKVYELAFLNLDHHRILFGTDMPIMLWHGKRNWENGGYHNLCREDFSWNKHPYPQEESSYTFFIYEQLRNILQTVGGDDVVLQNVFYRNAASVYLKEPV